MFNWNRLQPWGVFVVRIALGLSMFYHGAEKLLPPPGGHGPFAGLNYFSQFVVSLGLPFWLGYVSVFTEFLGGLCLLLGLFTRVAAFFIAGNMLVALITVNSRHGLTSSEYTLALIFMSVALILAGSGPLALDRGTPA